MGWHGIGCKKQRELFLMSHVCVKDLSLTGISFCVSTSSLEKETHGSNTASFSLLPCPFLFRDERVTFLIRDSRKRNTVGLCGSPGGVPLRSPFKKELDSELQRVKLVDSLQVLKAMFFLGSPNQWLNVAGVPRPGISAQGGTPLIDSACCGAPQWVGRRPVKCALRSQALLPNCAFSFFYLSKLYLSIKCLHSCVSESASQETQQTQCGSVALPLLCPSVCLSLSLSSATPKIHPLSQTPCGKFPGNDFPLQVGGCILRHAVRQGGSGGLIMAICSVSLCNSILEWQSCYFSRLSVWFLCLMSQLVFGSRGKQSGFIYSLDSSMNRKNNSYL